MATYRLHNEDIDAVSEILLRQAGEYAVPRQAAQRIRITVEELLLKYQQAVGQDTEWEIGYSRQFGKINLTMTIPGERFDPFDSLSEEDLLLHNVMESMGYVPDWQYKRGNNIITFTVRRAKKLPAWAPIVIAAAAGILLGFAAQLLPEGPRTVLTDTVFAPLSSTIMGLLGTVSVLMVFLSIISGICGMGNMATLNLLGKRMIGRFLLLLLIAAVGAVLVLSLIFPVARGGAGSFDLAALWQMILGIVPSNIIDAFQKGNTLQVIFLAACMGIVTLSMIRKMHALTEWTQQLNVLVQALVEVIIKLLPVVVFISLFNLFATDAFMELKIVYKLPLYHLLLNVGWLILLLFRTAIMQKVNPWTLFKKLLPTLVITLSTASSSAAFSTNMETCEKKLGIDKQVVNVGVPLSQSLFKPSFVIESLVGIFCLAEIYRVDLTWSIVIPAAITVYVLSLAAPPLPGAAISCFALLLGQCGIPAAAISVIIALNAVSDRITTPSMVMSAQLELVQLAASLGKLDKNVLRKK